jgi:hypothetical protein
MMQFEGTEEVAVQRFAEVWSDFYLLSDIGEKLTCCEAEALAGVLRVLDHEDVADALLAAHAEGDDEGDDHYVDTTDQLTTRGGV